MHDRDGKIWMDGELVDWRDAKIHVLSHTLHYGCGAFEGVRAYDTANGTAIFRLQEHTERLFNSAKILRMKIPFTPEQVNEAQRTVVRDNKLESGYMRPLDLDWFDRSWAFQPKGNQIHLMVAAWTWGAYLGEDGMKRGIRVKTSQLHPPPCQHHHDAGQGGEQLHQLHLGQHGSAGRRLRRGACCWTPRALSPKARVKTCSSSRAA
jgi:branched-subunit amino acid aminotransferase/4-amino-4-deoxychorismate lyase